MALYTFESPLSLGRLQNATPIVADTSYLIGLSEASHPLHSLVQPFHIATLQRQARFVIPDMVRHEFLKRLRKAVIIEAVGILLRQETWFERDFRSEFKITRALISPNHIEAFAERAVKMLACQNKLAAFQAVISSLCTTQSIYKDMERFEQASSVVYTTDPNSAETRWNYIESFMQQFCLSPSDSEIALFSFAVNATALVTLDKDYAVVSRVLDVYMPYRQAEQCVQYNFSVDFPSGHARPT